MNLNTKRAAVAEIALGRAISGDREISRDALIARAACAATGLGELGVGPGDAIAVVLRNDFAFFEASYAAQRLGAYSVPVNWHGKTREIAYVLKDCGAKAVVAHADLLPEIAPAVPLEVPLFVVPTPPEIAAAYRIAGERCLAPPDIPQWEDLVTCFPPLPEAEAGMISSMIYTSGTTGNPKGLRRLDMGPQAARLFAAVVGDCFGIAPDRVVRTVITGPLYHSAPNAYGLYAVRTGGLAVLQPRFEAEELLRLIEQYRITHLHMVPTMFVRLLRLPDAVKHSYDLSSLEWVVHGAAPCPIEVKRAMIEWWGPVIYEYYGATETGIATFHSSHEALRKPGTVGRALPGGTVRVYDTDGRSLSAGEVGEIYLWQQGFPDFTYHGQDDKRREVGRDGLVTLGDVGYLDEDGYLFICARARDMVISGGVNIYPAEIEMALVAMPGVRDCAVFGIPDEEFGETLCAHIEPDPAAPPGAAEVAAFLRERLADFKVPRVIEFATTLPREDSGKIIKRTLREPYWAAAGRTI
jgi:long-chain acyl-CoA synthetase